MHPVKVSFECRVVSVMTEQGDQKVCWLLLGVCCGGFPFPLLCENHLVRRHSACMTAYVLGIRALSGQEHD